LSLALADFLSAVLDLAPAAFLVLFDFAVYAGAAPLLIASVFVSSLLIVVDRA
jgi:hypothetical protein